jgi:quercetin dioxygenase-like cupin family protein
MYETRPQEYARTSRIFDGHGFASVRGDPKVTGVTMPKKSTMRDLSFAAESAVPKIETDIRRRLVLAGMAGAACAFSSKPLLAKAASPDATIVSPDGIVRQTLESYVNEAGEDFRLVLVSYPPGVGLPAHHHPSVGHNYVLEGVAESQYAGEELKRLTSGQSYQDKADEQHTVFRNPDKTSALKYLLVYTVKKGRSFLIIP